MSSEAVGILSTHVLIAHPRSGQAACTKEGCEWELKTDPWTGHPVPPWVRGPHSHHLLELMEAAGLFQSPCTRRHLMKAPRDDSGW